MSSSGIRRRLRTRALAWGDAFVYALVVAAFSTLLAVVVGVATGGGLVRAKVLLFLAGVGLMAYATVRLWPESPGDRDDRAGPGLPDPGGGPAFTSRERPRLQRVTAAVPPMRWVHAPPPEERVTVPGKLFWSSVAILLVSYLMEAVFGIA